MPHFDYFDRLAAVYDRIIRPLEGSELIPLEGGMEPGRLLDVGGGTGRAAHALRGHAKLLVVVDTSIKMLMQAQAKPGLRNVASQAEALPFAKACFQNVLMVDSYHHLEDQDQSLTESWRVLEPGGRLVIEEPDVQSFIGRLVAVIEKLLLMRSHLVPAGRLVSQLRSLGAEVQTQREGSQYRITAQKPGLGGS